MGISFLSFAERSRHHHAIRITCTRPSCCSEIIAFIFTPCPKTPQHIPYTYTSTCSLYACVCVEICMYIYTRTFSVRACVWCVRTRALSSPNAPGIFGITDLVLNLPNPGERANAALNDHCCCCCVCTIFVRVRPVLMRAKFYTAVMCAATLSKIAAPQSLSLARPSRFGLGSVCVCGCCWSDV